MEVFKNTHFTKRNYECTNVVACELIRDALQPNPKAPEGYEACDPEILSGLTSLWIEAGVRYYGHM